MSTVNIFTRYEQEENRFTNGLISVLRMGPLEHAQGMQELGRNWSETVALRQDAAGDNRRGRDKESETNQMGSGLSLGQHLCSRHVACLREADTIKPDT